MRKADFSLQSATLPRLRRALRAWYAAHARDLPWRRTRDPYRVWLSEIMLQQTRVETATPYYARFLAAFPDVEALAAAPLERVLKLWEGLGYYTRARNLHRAAQCVVTEQGGRFPASAADWRTLPGVGPYTAAAIASIVAGEPAATVDGNIQRVLARVFRVETALESPATQRRIWQLADALLDRRRPGDFNQALMELGARLCKPRQPLCGDCPAAKWCLARHAGVVERLPVRARKRPVPRVDAVAALVHRRGRWLLVRRPERGLLARLWGWPCFEQNGLQLQQLLHKELAELAGIVLCAPEPLGVVRHQFSHRDLHAHVYRVECVAGSSPQRSARLRWVRPADLQRYSLATLDRKIWSLHSNNTPCPTALIP